MQNTVEYRLIYLDNWGFKLKYFFNYSDNSGKQFFVLFSPWIILIIASFSLDFVWRESRKILHILPSIFFLLPFCSKSFFLISERSNKWYLEAWCCKRFVYLVHVRVHVFYICRITYMYTQVYVKTYTYTYMFLYWKLFYLHWIRQSHWCPDSGYYQIVLYQHYMYYTVHFIYSSGCGGAGMLFTQADCWEAEDTTEATENEILGDYRVSQQASPAKLLVGLTVFTNLTWLCEYVRDSTSHFSRHLKLFPFFSPKRSCFFLGVHKPFYGIFFSRKPQSPFLFPLVLLSYTYLLFKAFTSFHIFAVTW